MNINRKAFLDMLGVSEGTSTIPGSDGGYRVLVGSTAARPILFDNYADHPRILNKQFNSSAAGKFQILERFFDGYKKQLYLPDFGPSSQDAIALQMIAECHALDDIDAGRFDDAVFKCRSRWASLPGANYSGQHMQKIKDLRLAYSSAGGRFS